MLESLYLSGKHQLSPSERFVRMANKIQETLEKEPLPEDETSTSPQQVAKAPHEEKSERQDSGPVSGSGTGFAVTTEGHLLTNAHVVDGCERLSVDGNEAKLLATEENFDLALLQVPGLEVKQFAVFADNPAPLNSDITTAGFPLAGLLGGLNITRGG